MRDYGEGALPFRGSKKAEDSEFSTGLGRRFIVMPSDCGADARSSFGRRHGLCKRRIRATARIENTALSGGPKLKVVGDLLEFVLDLRRIFIVATAVANRAMENSNFTLHPSVV